MPTQPNANKGTLILLAPNAPDANVSSKNVFFTFQYNPEKLMHTFSQGAPDAATNPTTEAQVEPSEYFSLTLDFDSVDVEAPPQSAASLGLHPALAMLELMMQPQVVGNKATAPIVVFRWGTKRQVAAQILSMSIEEKTFDPALNPTRASVSLTLKVLDPSRIGNNPGARSVAAGHENTRASLVDAYKWDTGQASPQVAPASATTANEKQAVSASAAQASSGQPKKKRSA